MENSDYSVKLIDYCGESVKTLHGAAVHQKLAKIFNLEKAAQMITEATQYTDQDNNIQYYSNPGYIEVRPFIKQNGNVIATKTKLIIKPIER